jgi:hypothetical protein
MLASVDSRYNDFPKGEFYTCLKDARFATKVPYSGTMSAMPRTLPKEDGTLIYSVCELIFKGRSRP